MVRIDLAGNIYADQKESAIYKVNSDNAVEKIETLSDTHDMFIDEHDRITYKIKSLKPEIKCQN